MPIQTPHNQPLLVGRGNWQANVVKVICIEPPKALNDPFRPSSKFSATSGRLQNKLEEANVHIIFGTQDGVVGTDQAGLLRIGKDAEVGFQAIEDKIVLIDQLAADIALRHQRSLFNLCRLPPMRSRSLFQLLP